MDMGERIKQLRIQHDMTQEELGRVLNLKKSAIAKYETGRVENIKRSTIQKMADVFGVDPSYILGMNRTITDKERRLAEKYIQARRSNDPVLRALIDAIDKLIKVDEQ